MEYNYGNRKKRAFFEGWYFKCQTGGGESIALIPALHMDGGGQTTASIQAITAEGSWCVSYPGTAFHRQNGIFQVQIGNNRFSESGMELCIHEAGLDLQGRISFGPFHRLVYPIMGPFQLIPNMECSHAVLSMKHELRGALRCNGEWLDFTGGIGYLESDRGSSFPSSYLWAQDVWEGGSIMLSIATIPFGRLSFTGCICGILLNGREYRLATYLGSKVEHWSENHAQVKQGRYRLDLEVLNRKEQPLHAPVTGRMIRTIHESLCSDLHIRLWKGENLLLDRRTDCGGFEYVPCGKLKKPQ